MTIATLHSGAIAPLDHHLRPVTTSSSVASSSSIRVAMLSASEDATSGSVMEYAERMVPSSSGVEPPLLHRRAGEVGEHLHVAGVRGGAVHRLRREHRRAARQLGQRRVLQVGQPGAAVPGQEQVPQAPLARLRLELLHHRRPAPGVAVRLLGHLLREGGLRGEDHARRGSPARARATARRCCCSRSPCAPTYPCPCAGSGALSPARRSGPVCPGVQEPRMAAGQHRPRRHPLGAWRGARRGADHRSAGPTRVKHLPAEAAGFEPARGFILNPLSRRAP